MRVHCVDSFGRDAAVDTLEIGDVEIWQHAQVTTALAVDIDHCAVHVEFAVTGVVDPCPGKQRRTRRRCHGDGKVPSAAALPGAATDHALDNLPGLSVVERE